jgi:hypothetical protein
MPGLDPGIHAVARQQICSANGLDCRVKPGNDEITFLKGGYA